MIGQLKTYKLRKVAMLCILFIHVIPVLVSDYWQRPNHVHLMSSYSLRMLLFADVNEGRTKFSLKSSVH